MVYFISGEGTKLVKIGFTTQSPFTRMMFLQIGSPVKLELVGILPDCGRSEENRLHRAFREFRSHGEWFDLSLDDIKRETSGLVEVKKGSAYVQPYMLIHKEKRKEANRKFRSKPEQRERNRERMSSPEYLARARERAREMSPEQRAKRNERQRKYMAKPGHKEAQRKRMSAWRARKRGEVKASATDGPPHAALFEEVDS